jgi:hypothetical protein
VRTVAGFAGFHLLLAVSGTALLHALGLLRTRPRELVAAVGPAVFCGAALVLPLQIALLVLGVPFNLPVFTAVALGSASLLAAWSRLTARGGAASPGPVRVEPADRWTVRIGAVALAVFFVVGARAFVHLPTVEDDTRVWSLKALGLFFFDGIDNEVFTDGAYAASHLGYPILQPLLEAGLYRAMGDFDLRLAHLERWVVFASFLWTVAFLLRDRGRPLLWLAPIGALAVAPGVFEQITIGYADITAACFGAAGVLCLGLWLERRASGHLILGVLFLAAATNTKNDGYAAALAGVVAAVAVVAGARIRPALAPVGAATAVALAAGLPWRIWTATKDTTTPISAELGGPAVPRPRPEVSRFDRLESALDGVATQLAHQGRWMWVVPAAIAIAAATLLEGRSRRVAAYYLAAGVLVVGALVAVYTEGPLVDLGGELGATVDRTISTSVFVATVAAAHLLSLREPARGASGLGGGGAAEGRAQPGEPAVAHDHEQ